MWGIDRVGQKVQCVQDEFIWQFVCWELPCYLNRPGFAGGSNS